MPTERLSISDSVIKRLAASQVTELADTRHGAVRFRYHSDRQSGSWFLVTHRGGRTHWRKFGRWPQVPTRRALASVPDLMAEAATAATPSAVVSGLEIVDDLLNWYNDRVQSDRQASASRRRNVATAVCRHLSPMIGHLSLVDLTKPVLDERLLWPLQQRYAPSTCRHILATLKAATRKATTLCLLDKDPLSSVRFSDFIPAPIIPKGSSLKPSDLPAVLQCIRKAEPGPRTLCWMMLLYGTRIGESRRTHRPNIDISGAWWHIPAEDTKTGRAHRLPLTDFAVDKLQPMLGTDRYLFEGREGPISETTANRWVQKVSGRRWTAHDLRKLARTCWMDLGVDYMIAELLLNHTQSRLDRTYIHSYADERQRQAIEKWHKRIQSENPGALIK